MFLMGLQGLDCLLLKIIHLGKTVLNLYISLLCNFQRFGDRLLHVSLNQSPSWEQVSSVKQLCFISGSGNDGRFPKLGLWYKQVGIFKKKFIVIQLQLSEQIGI